MPDPDARLAVTPHQLLDCGQTLVDTARSLYDLAVGLPQTLRQAGAAGAGLTTSIRLDATAQALGVAVAARAEQLTALGRRLIDAAGEYASADRSAVPSTSAGPR